MALILLALGIYIISRFVFRKPPKFTLGTRPRTVFLAPLGLFAGFVDATGGGGWGPVATLSLISSGKLEPRRVIGSVSAAEFAVTVAASLGFITALGTQGIDPAIVLALLGGGVIAAPFAAYLVRRLSLPLLGALVGGVILITNSRTLMRTFDAERVWVYLVLLAVWAGLIALAFRKNREIKAELAAEAEAAASTGSTEPTDDEKTPSRPAEPRGSGRPGAVGVGHQAHRSRDLRSRTWLDVESAVDRQALDEGIEHTRRRRVEMSLESATAAGHPGVGQRAVPRVASGQRVELVGEDQLVRVGQHVGVDQCDHGLAGLGGRDRACHRCLEPVADLLRETLESGAQQLVDVLEVVADRPERHVRGRRDPARRRPGHAVLADHQQTGLDDPVAPVRSCRRAPLRHRPSPGTIRRITRAGLPTATTPAGRSRTTTAPAPTTVSSPMVTPGHTITPPPSHTLSPIVIGAAASSLSRRGCGSTGCVGVSSCTFGPIWQCCPIVIVATSSAVSPELTNVRAPRWMFSP